MPSILHVILDKFPLAAPISPLYKGLDKISGFLFFSFIFPSHLSWITMNIDRIFIYNHHKLKTTADEWKTSMCYTHTIDHNSARKRRNDRRHHGQISGHWAEETQKTTFYMRSVSIYLYLCFKSSCKDVFLLIFDRGKEGGGREKKTLM